MNKSKKSFKNNKAITLISLVVTIIVLIILAGISIAIGGTIYLAVENAVVGAFLFSVGLFGVCTFGLNLFTGKLLFVFENKASYLIDLLIIWVGNLVGAVITGTLVRMTRLLETVKGDVTILQKATNLCNVKLTDDLISIFVLAMLCNIMIYYAVENYKNNPHEIGKYLGIIFGVMVFILGGFEHCVANMFYFTVANVWSANTFLYLIVMSLGNFAGGIIFPLGKVIKAKLEKE